MYTFYEKIRFMKILKIYLQKRTVLIIALIDISDKRERIKIK